MCPRARELFLAYINCSLINKYLMKDIARNVNESRIVANVSYIYITVYALRF